MSGALALLDDVAALARLASTQMDDVAAQAAKVGSKTAGIIIDDAAVTPKYVVGIPAARELPMIWRIARGSFFNKLVILLPIAMLLEAFAPWLLTPLLMIGGAYLCFEGGEKVLHWIKGDHDEGHVEPETLDQAHLEEKRVKGAIKTDFILSAEIMTISLAAIEVDGFVMKGVVLAVVAIVITIAVYGSVALLVKMDDIGLKLSQIGRLSATRAFGRWLVSAMPTILKIISTVGTTAMLWVGGSIIVHGLKEFGWKAPYAIIHDAAVAVGGALSSGFAEWFVTAALDGVIGLAVGLILVKIFFSVKGMVGAPSH